MSTPKADAPEPTFRIPALELRPEGAMALGDIIEQRVKDLLSLSCEPKQLTDALKMATEWWKVRKEMEAGEGYGAKLGRGTMRGEE